MKNLERFKNKKIAILGLGIENRALVDFLIAKKVQCDITICDSRPEIEPDLKKDYKGLNYILGKKYDKSLDDFDIVSRIAGYPLFTDEIKKADKAGVEITSATKLFFELCPTRNIIGVTGTKGKGTTSGLIYHGIKKNGKQVFWGGNIGIAMFSFIEKIKADTWVVLELSSFQLEDLEISPKIAVVTNFSREHLEPADPLNPNHHKTISDYWHAKTNIFKWQKAGEHLIVNEKLRGKISKSVFQSEITYFDKLDLTSKLVGEHNKENIAAAVLALKLAGIKDEEIGKAIASFNGLEYRIEFVKEIKGVKYYNDSFATTPEATIVALRSFAEPVVLLVGGADKGADFKKLAKEIKERVKFVVLLHGRATPRIKKMLDEYDYPKSKMKLERDIKAAVKTVKQKAISGDVVLLSTACASFGMFKNYKERGRLFKELV